MKLLVDIKAQRVVFAEAGKEVVDFLFSLLALPLSAVTKLLATSGTRAQPLDHQRFTAAAEKLPTTTTTCAMVGSVGNLYHSLESLDAGGHVCCRDAAKDALLKPATILQLTPAASAPAEAPPNTDGGQLFRCKGCSCSPRCYDYATRVSGTPCPVCKRKMTTEVQFVEPDGGAAANAGSGSSGGYVRDTVTYTVLDDLSVAPISTITAVTALVSLGVTDISGLQAKDVEIGYKESQMVLTDVFLGSNSKQSAA
ncbi:uncharacterized protein [Miscanthus floridulus]|uniref:uncharacterized protein n=1 Tax=Miscanthus floridulus TaxID=154761 RepID=UPI00345A0FBC